jgi:hypothetical protein
VFVQSSLYAIKQGAARSRKEEPKRGKKSSESTHIHMELVDFGKDPTNRSVATANQDPEWIKVPE